MTRRKGALLGLLVVALIVLGAEVTHPDRVAKAATRAISAAITADRVVLTGTVPSAQAKNDAGVAAARLVGGDLTRVTNRLEIGGRAQGPWLAAYLAGLAATGTDVRPLTYALAGNAITLTGTAPSAAARAALEAALAAKLGSGTTIDNQVTVEAGATSTATAETVTTGASTPPGAVILRWDSGSADISGIVPSAADKVSLGKAAERLGGVANTRNGLTVKAGSGDAAFVAAAVRAIERLDAKVAPVKLAAEGGSLTVTSTVATAAAKRTLLARMKAAAAPTLKIVDQVTVKAAPAQALQDTLDRDLTGKTIEFETGSAVLTPKGVAVLTTLLPAIKRSTLALSVDGYTDNVGAAASNTALSLARARTVVRFLVSRGVAAGRLTAQGFGASRPIASNASQAGRQRNRRIVLQVKKG